MFKRSDFFLMLGLRLRLPLVQWSEDRRDIHRHLGSRDFRLWNLLQINDDLGKVK
jgi:hypothetical protein